jgi:hypothetical protein
MCATMCATGTRLAYLWYESLRGLLGAEIECQMMEEILRGLLGPEIECQMMQRLMAGKFEVGLRWD